MKSLFDLDNPVLRFFGRVFDIAYLNILCVVCSIPVITIGPSVTALYYCLLKIARKQDSSITRMFFDSLKMNLKQGILMTLIFAGLAAILVVDIQMCNNMTGENAEYLKTFLYVVFAVAMVMASYAFPVLAQFDNTTVNILKYSLLLAIYNFGYTILIVLLNVVPIVVFVLLPELFLWTFPAWLTFGFAIIAMINSKMFVKIFEKVMPNNQEES